MWHYYLGEVRVKKLKQIAGVPMLLCRGIPAPTQLKQMAEMSRQHEVRLCRGLVI